MSELNHVEEYCRALGVEPEETFLTLAAGRLRAQLAAGIIYLDGGKLDIGLMRDSTINSGNEFTVFAETFE